VLTSGSIMIETSSYIVALMPSPIYACSKTYAQKRHVNAEVEKNIHFPSGHCKKPERFIDMPQSPSNEPLRKHLKTLEAELSDRKKIEQDLKQQLKDYRQMVENINDVVFQLDIEGRFTYVSRVIEYMTGYKPKELLGRQFYEFIHPEDLPFLQEKFLTRVSDVDAPPQTIDFRAIRKSGEYLWLRTSSRRLRQNGKVIGLTGVWTDIHSRKLAEEALKNTKDQLEAKVAERTQELLKINIQLATKSRHLEDVNTALRVLLERREEDRSEIEEKIDYNLRELVLPYLEKLKNTSLNEKQASYLKVAESNIESIVSPFSKSLSEKFLNLTPTELQIANLIQQGRSTKEIAQVLSVSNRTVESHRKGIRKKLNLNNRKTNLRSHLSTLSKSPIRLSSDPSV
jgi:PAS domain S-box-containing protein